VDLVLDGGSFNGAYTLGALRYFKALEKRGRLRVVRLSGCSAGAFLAVAYATDTLDSVAVWGRRMMDDFRQSQCLRTLRSRSSDWVENYIDADQLEGLCRRVTITYHDSDNKKQISTNAFDSKEALKEILVRSSYLPFLVDGKTCYQDRYFDGLTPMLFWEKARPSVFITAMVPGYLHGAIVVKGSNTISTRHLEGAEDLHSFFMIGQPSRFCSYVDKWSFCRVVMFRLRSLLGLLFLMVSAWAGALSGWVPAWMRQHYVVQWARQFLRDFTRDCIARTCY
jgi:hypothetical protein